MMIMNFKKVFFVFLTAIGFLACSSDDNDVAKGDNPEEGTPTYMNLSISFAKGNAKSLPEDYNPDGDYEGMDDIQTLDLYMVSTDGTLETKRFTGTDISKASNEVSVSQPFRTTSGTKTVYVVINSPDALGTVAPTDNALLPIANLAKMQSKDGTNYDVIMMTGKSTPTFIAPDVTVQAVANGANNVLVDLTRVASRVIVTTTAPTTLTAENGTVIGTISNLTYSVAQGTTQVYFMGQPNFVTYGSSYVTGLGDYTTTAPTYYDYSDLLTPSPVPAKPADYKTLPGKFLFENTHTYGADAGSSQYKKGNTAYVLVRAILTPNADAVADGGALVNNTFYVGQSDGKIYSSKAAAQTAVTNQKVALYENGKMLQYAWLNPDDITKPLNSPVVRNNIYHINILSFKKIGLNWNPLDPGPDNPDPKPGDPDEPTSPIDPTDPLTPEETYMNVEVTVLNWTVHSYDIDL